MPYTLLYRSVLEQCRTIDEAIAFLRNTPRQTANNLMLMDATGNRAVVEITPDNLNSTCENPMRADQHESPARPRHTNARLVLAIR